MLKLYNKYKIIQVLVNIIIIILAYIMFTNAIRLLLYLGQLLGSYLRCT